jgi:dTDP-4-dehydrorhamnose reductase
MKVLIVGSTGQLGSDILKVFDGETIPLTHEEIEVKDIDSCRRVLKGADVVINCAAYVNVDESEDHPDDAFMVNAVGARNVALVCAERKMKSVYISTDFVFDGQQPIGKEKPYNEDDKPNPINTYGLSKYAGEIFVKNYCEKNYIIRSASLYGEKGAKGKGGNFVDWMIKKANNNEKINVVSDIVMSPTYAKDVAGMLKNIIEKDLDYGVYHVVNQGYCSWFEFTKEIFKKMKIDVELFPIQAIELDRKARRPTFSALENKKLKKFGLRMRNWEDALEEYLRRKKYIT